MNIIVCIDENNGMMFNKRRQSQDSVVREKIIELSSGFMLYMNEYSAKQFAHEQGITVDNDFLSKAKTGDFCFIESDDIPQDNVEKVFLINWNRKYPSDKKFNFDLISNGFQKISEEEFAGSSHEKITLSVFGRDLK